MTTSNSERSGSSYQSESGRQQAQRFRRVDGGYFSAPEGRGGNSVATQQLGTDADDIRPIKMDAKRSTGSFGTIRHLGGLSHLRRG